MTLSRDNPDIDSKANKFIDKYAPKDSMVPLMRVICKESRNVAAKYDFCFQREPSLTVTSTLAESRIDNQMYPPVLFQQTSTGKPKSVLVDRRYHDQPYLDILFQPKRDTISFEDLSERGIKWALKSITSQNLKLSNIQSLAVPYTNSGAILACQVIQDSRKQGQILTQSREIIFVSKSGISRPTIFESNLKFILGGHGDFEGNRWRSSLLS